MDCVPYSPSIAICIVAKRCLTLDGPPFGAYVADPHQPSATAAHRQHGTCTLVCIANRALLANSDAILIRVDIPHTTESVFRRVVVLSTKYPIGDSFRTISFIILHVLVD